MINNDRPLPPLKALKAFEASARLQSLTRAAEELHVTQGAISQQVKLLEEYLDTQLFIRKPRKLELTDAARAYLPVLTEAFGSLQASTNELFGSDHRTLLKIRCGSSFMQQWLIPRLSDFYQRHPNIRVRLMSSVWSAIDSDDQADVEICNGYGDWRGMQVERLTEEVHLAVASPQFIELMGFAEQGEDYCCSTAEIACNDIAQLPLISVIGDRENWQRWFRIQKQTAPMPLLECDTTAAAVEAAKRGLGVLLARSFNLQPALERGELLQLHPFTLNASGAHYLIMPDQQHAPKVIAFRDWLKAQLFL